MKERETKSNLKRRVWVEIDVARLRANYAKIAAAVKPLKVLCVLKANAYGLGVMPYAAALAETDCAGFGVAEPCSRPSSSRADRNPSRSSPPSCPTKSSRWSRPASHSP